MGSLDMADVRTPDPCANALMDSWDRPRTPRQAGIKTLALRLDSLNGKTIVQLWDFLFRGDEIYAFLEEALEARFPGVKFISWRQFGNTHSRHEDELLAGLPARLKEVGADAVLSGMGC